jgi:RecJ-like exonuclease
MYKCFECGHIFEEGEEARWLEKHGLDTPPYQQMAGCPKCKGSYFEIEPCQICGSYDHHEFERFCFECKKKTKLKFEKLMSQNFSSEERVLLNELYDGKEI